MLNYYYTFNNIAGTLMDIQYETEKIIVMSWTASHINMNNLTRDYNIWHWFLLIITWIDENNAPHIVYLFAELDVHFIQAAEESEATQRSRSSVGFTFAIWFYLARKTNKIQS